MLGRSRTRADRTDREWPRPPRLRGARRCCGTNSDIEPTLRCQRLACGRTRPQASHEGTDQRTTRARQGQARLTAAHTAGRQHQQEHWQQGDVAKRRSGSHHGNTRALSVAWQVRPVSGATRSLDRTNQKTASGYVRRLEPGVPARPTRYSRHAPNSLNTRVFWFRLEGLAALVAAKKSGS